MTNIVPNGHQSTTCIGLPVICKFECIATVLFHEVHAYVTTLVDVIYIHPSPRVFTFNVDAKFSNLLIKFGVLRCFLMDLYTLPLKISSSSPIAGIVHNSHPCE